MKQEAGVHMKVVRCTKLEINITTCLEGRGGDATAEDRYPFQRFLSACKQAGILSAVPSTPLKDSLSAELLGVCQAGGDRGCVSQTKLELSGTRQHKDWDLGHILVYTAAFMAEQRDLLWRVQTST
ncbi:uncharacterized protein LOC143694357 isoform X2 [Agelaius phoeniceus]|uniref:uncharacterized protein LOC143694357 isoform X2 n=1 Tax=Agelaius phoeniceus TaxID=39638 RepID=UPI004054E07D